MAHKLNLSCPNCKQPTKGFTDVEYSLLEGGAVLCFEAFCQNCQQPVFTLIGAQIFAEWAALDDFKAPPQDEDFLRGLNIRWNEEPIN